MTACLLGALAITMDPNRRVQPGAPAGMVVIFLVAVALQAGYVLAPWLVPRGSKVLCLGLMSPVALFVLVLVLGEGSLRSGLVFSASSESNTPARRNAFAAYSLVVSYIVPPVLLLFYE